MWLVAINPTSGQGRGARLASEVVGFLKREKIEHVAISGMSADDLKERIENFLKSNHITGILSVGGDGLAHLILQIAVP